MAVYCVQEVGAGFIIIPIIGLLESVAVGKAFGISLVYYAFENLSHNFCHDYVMRSV